MTIDRFKCFGCGTMASEPAICTGCGNLMTSRPPDASFMVVTYNHGAIDRVIGPFRTVTEADMFWLDIEHSPEFEGVKYSVEIASNPEVIKRGIKHDGV